MRRRIIAALMGLVLTVPAVGVVSAYAADQGPPGGCTPWPVCKKSPTPTPTPTPSPSPSPSPGPIGTPTPHAAGWNLAAGQTVINPIIDCNSDPVNTTGGASGIIADESNITIINPSIRECANGVLVQGNPTNVRIIAHAAYVGYTGTNFTLNRQAIRWVEGNGEVGDVSVPDAQVGGEMYFQDDYRYLSAVATTGFRMHHVTATCVACPTFSGSDAPGAMWGLKFLFDRRTGTEVSHVRFDHNEIGGFEEEGIGFDSAGANAPAKVGYDFGTVSSVGASSVTVPDIATTENVVGMFVTVNEGAATGRTLRITGRAGDVLTVSGSLTGITVGTRVSVGGRFFDNRIDHNLIHALNSKTAIGFHGGSTFSRIEANTIDGTPSFVYEPPFHTRFEGAPQCMMVRSMAGPGVPMFSFYNSVVGNTCDGSGDITASVISWGTYEVDSPTWLSSNTFSGTPTGQVWRYKAPQPAADPTG